MHDKMSDDQILSLPGLGEVLQFYAVSCMQGTTLTCTVRLLRLEEWSVLIFVLQGNDLLSQEVTRVITLLGILCDNNTRDEVTVFKSNV